MGQPEADDVFRARVLTAVAEVDRTAALTAAGPALDAIGRRCGRFRTGVPLDGLGETDPGSRAFPSPYVFLDPMRAALRTPSSRVVFWDAVETTLPSWTHPEVRRSALENLIRQQAQAELLETYPDARFGAETEGRLAAIRDELTLECEVRGYVDRPLLSFFAVKTPERRFEVDLYEVPIYQPAPPTVAGVPSPQGRLDDRPVRAFLVVGRMGAGHTLAYLFLGGDPTLEQVEALVRAQPGHFPSDAVVVDLGESYRSHAAAEARVTEMRANLPRAVTFLVADLDGGRGA